MNALFLPTVNSFGQVALCHVETKLADGQTLLHCYFIILRTLSKEHTEVLALEHLYDIMINKQRTILIPDVNIGDAIRASSNCLQGSHVRDGLEPAIRGLVG
jgi:hypothetical protein